MFGFFDPVHQAAPDAAVRPQLQPVETDSLQATHTPPATHKPPATRKPQATHTPGAAIVQAELSSLLRWLLHDAPYIALLLLALAGVVFRLPVIYWVILTPMFAVISAAAGWRYCVTPSDRLGLVARLALCWSALLLAIYLLYNNGVSGVLNANAQSLTMMTLLALGTFVAGVQARVWRICVVGGLLFLAVPALGWLDQSPLLLTAATVVIIAVGACVWWLSQSPPAMKNG